MNNKEKIIGIITATFLFLCVVLLIFFTRLKSENRLIDGIIIQGANVLPKAEYLKFSRLNKGDLNKLSLFEIRQRFLPHKYLKNVDVEVTADHKVYVHIEEKKFISTLINMGMMFLVSDDGELTKVIDNTSILDFPAFTNIRNYQKNGIERPDPREIEEAKRVLNSTKIIDGRLYSELSEVNMRNGGEIILSFSHLGMPVLFGRKNYLEKIAKLSALENKREKFSALLQNSVYLDLRYENNVFIGYNEIVGIN